MTCERALAATLRLNATLTSLNLGWNHLGEGGGRALAETLRLNTTVTSLNLSDDGLGEGGGQALAEALRLNTKITLLYCRWNDLRKEVPSALGRAWEFRVIGGFRPMMPSNFMCANLGFG
jgi:hypothetical protein